MKPDPEKMRKFALNQSSATPVEHDTPVDMLKLLERLG